MTLPFTLIRAMSSYRTPSSLWIFCSISPSYVNDLEHSRPNVHAIFLRHLATRRDSRAPVTLAMHDMPTSAICDRPRLAPSMSANGLDEYVYREPAVSRTPGTSVTMAGSASHGRESDSLDVATPSISPFSSPQIRSELTTPPSCPTASTRGSAARASTIDWWTPITSSMER